MKATRAWLCQCMWFYSGEGPAWLLEEEPDEDACHRWDCGWVEITREKLPEEMEAIEDVRLDRQVRADDPGTGSALRSLQPWKDGMAARALSQLDGPFSWGSDA